MVLNNIKINRKDSGFTIVELLVVIVVIGILAAITIVSYTGITAKANTTKALSNANSVLNVGEVYFADKAIYPAANATTAMTTADWTSLPTIAKLPAGLHVIQKALDGTTGLDSISVECLDTCTNTTGLKIGYYDFSTNTTKYLYSGATTGTYVFPAS